ncbi:hypothetical protein C8Q78DRAFT_471236 [Trametes maxima]|nr:hypothetical protein C8Q78DRAFT_471236 [Trametes maxima]
MLTMQSPPTSFGCAQGGEGSGREDAGAWQLRRDPKSIAPHWPNQAPAAEAAAPTVPIPKRVLRRSTGTTNARTDATDRPARRLPIPSTRWPWPAAGARPASEPERSLGTCIPPLRSCASSCATPTPSRSDAPASSLVLPVSSSQSPGFLPCASARVRASPLLPHTVLRSYGRTVWTAPPLPPANARARARARRDCSAPPARPSSPSANREPPTIREQRAANRRTATPLRLPCCSAPVREGPVLPPSLPPSQSRPPVRRGDVLHPASCGSPPIGGEASHLRHCRSRPRIRIRL